MESDPHVWQPDDIFAGKYRLVRVLGEGGMGIVYEAYHLRLRQRLAIKMLRPALATRYNVVVRFEREARAAVQLRSAHVAKVIDVDATPDGAPYIVMEFLEGRNLSQVTAEKKPTIHEAVGWVLETCCAIAEAHDLGVVHRDLKPSNLLLASDGNRSIVKVLDFGISKVADETENDASLTTTQGTLGTPQYMSPEQVRSAKHVDSRTDIWSLGVILYELLTGAMPFHGTTPTAVGAAIVADPVPDMRELRPDLPAELEAVVIKCLSKRVDDRFTDIRSLASALAPFAKLDPQVSAELAQMLADRSRRSSPPAGIHAGPAAAGAPSVPGWSQITAFPTRPQKWTLSFAAVAMLAAAGWFAQSRLRRGTVTDVAAPSSLPPPLAVTTPSSSSLAVGSTAADAFKGAPPLLPSERIGSSAADASVATPAPQVGPRPGSGRGVPRPSGNSPNTHPASPPIPSSNPLHL